MIFFLYGDDSYRARQKLDEIMNRYREVRNGGFNLAMMDAEKTDFEDFLAALQATSLFTEKKLSVVRNLFSNKNFQEPFLNSLKAIQTMPDIVAIYENGAVDERTKLFKELKKTAACQEFQLLDASKVRQWAQTELQKINQKINADALDMLARSTGNDLWRLSSEIQKLTCFKSGETIRKDDVALLVKPRIETDIFKTIDALAARDKRQALDLLQKHLEAGESPLYLLTMIAYQVRNLLVVKELSQQGLMYDSIVRRSGLHPFVVRKNYAACRQFSFDALKHIYRMIFDMDSKIKNGGVDQETALGLLVASV